MPLAVRILLREAATGCVLYEVLGKDARLNAVLCSIVGIALALTTRKYSLLDRKDGLGLAIECLVIFCGALVFRSLLILLLTLPAQSN